MNHRSSFLFHHWRAKLGSLALAVVLWLAIRHGIGYSPTRSAAPAAVAEAVPKQ